MRMGSRCRHPLQVLMTQMLPVRPSGLTVANKEVVLPLTPVSWQFYAAADYNGDGIVDITWRQPDGTLTVWLMNRDGAAPTVISNAGSAPVGYAVLFP